MMEDIIKEQQARIKEVDKYLHDSKLRDSARDELYKILYKKKINMECSMNICNDNSIQMLYDEVQLLKEQNNRETSQQYYYWITFNPKEDITLTQLKKFADKLLSKKWITDAIYNYEQRGKTLEECGKGMHIHMLILRNKFHTTHAKRETYNTFKKLTGIPKDIFDVKCFKAIPYSWGKDKIDYLQGKKWDEEKDCMVEMDAVFRQKNNLSTYYTYGSLWKN